MANSESSSDVNITFHDRKGKIGDQSDIKKSSETDMYFGLLANQNKTVAEVSPHTESSSIESESTESASVKSGSTYKSNTNKSNKSKVNSKDRYEKMDFGTTFDKKASKKNSFKTSSIPVGSALSPQEVRMKKIELLRKLS